MDEVTEPVVPQAEDDVSPEYRQTLDELPSSLFVTRAIIFVNILVFAVMVARGASFLNPDAQILVNWGANFGPMTLNGQWWRLLSHMFLHVGMVHLGMNLWVLWGLAHFVEKLIGSAGFGIAYMTAGILGGIASLAWNPIAVSAGASGAVFGTAGVLLGFISLRRDTIPSVERKQMLRSIFNFLVLNTVIGLSVPRIDVAAHIGGFVGGVLIGMMLSQPIRRDMIRYRKYKNLMAVATGCLVVPIAIAALPDAPPDVDAEMRRLATLEREIYDAYNADSALRAQGRMTDEEFADRIELTVIPPWKEYGDVVESFRKLQYVDQNLMAKLARYHAMRLESWVLLVEGLRERDNEKMIRADELSRECNEMMANE